MVSMCLALLLGLAACGDRDTQPAQPVGTIGVTETPPTATVAPSAVRAASPTVSVSTPATDASPTSSSPATAMSPPAPAQLAQPAIAALDATTGVVRWQQHMGPTSQPLVGGDVLYLIGDTQSLVALDLGTGAERWRIPVPDGSLLSVADEATAYLEFGQAVHAIDAASGQERWVAAGFSAVAAADGIVVGRQFPDSGLRVLEAATGQERWSIAAGVIEPPIVAGGTVYAALAASERGGDGVYALDAVTGATRWAVEIPGGHAVAVTAGNVVIFSWENTREIIAVDEVSGQERWRYTTNADYGIGNVVASDGSLYVIAPGAESGSPLFALEPQTGSVRWEATGYRWPIGATTGFVVVVADQPPADDTSQVLGLDEATGVPRWSHTSGRIWRLVVSGTTIVVAT
jgi:outer membrane protein assembly factor BamB